ncbi:MAG: ADP-ribosylglycohydrolase family protein [Spirochaetales bacterium]|nr:ADP-ribosylglycohydrolase family protein [Spirochaetales bacterium]
MKAWQYISKLTEEAIPVVLSEEEQTWDAADEIERQTDALLKLQWSSNVPGSGAPESVIIAAVQSMESMGYDVSSVEEILPEGLAALKNNDTQKLQAITARVFKMLYDCPIDKSSDYWNYKVYESFDEYAEGLSFPKTAEKLSPEVFQDLTRAGWIGRLCGGALGTGIEGYTTNQLTKKFGEIRDYVRKPNTYNDDITYEIAFLKACQLVDKIPSSSDIAEQWVALVPSGWSAEQVALDNIKRGIFPPESGKFRNAYREWIGAQMRGAICGQVAPGDAYTAAKLAWADAEISHHGNGILGEVFNAVLVSLSYGATDMKSVLKQSIELIPEDSEYSSVIRFAWEQCESGKSFSEAWAACEEKYNKYNWIHAYPNAAAEVVSLYFGEGDFDETMYYISTCGQDVDCNAAQIAVAIGAMNGTSCIADKWSKPIGDIVQTYMRGMKEIKLDTLVEWTVQVSNMIEADCK